MVFRPSPAVLALSVILVLPGPVTAAQLDVTQLSRMVPARLSVIWKNRYKANIKLSSNGKVYGKYRNWSDTGTWHLRGEKLCVAFDSWTSGKFKCGKIWHQSDGTYVGFRRVSGEPRLQFHIRK